MQLLMRRPEIEGFISIAPPANLYDFSFLAPCPSSGLIIHGDKDAVVPHKDVTGLVDKLKTQKGIVIEQKVVTGANHFFDGKVEPLMQSVNEYLDKPLQHRAQAERGVEQAAQSAGSQERPGRPGADRGAGRRAGKGQDREGGPWRVRERASGLLRRPGHVLCRQSEGRRPRLVTAGHSGYSEKRR